MPVNDEKLIDLIAQENGIGMEKLMRKNGNEEQKHILQFH